MSDVDTLDYRPALRVTVLWPDGPRSVPSSTIMDWAHDSWMNDSDCRRCHACGQEYAASDLRPPEVPEGICIHDADWTPIYPEGVEEPKTLDAAIKWLADTGEATVACQNGDEPLDVLYSEEENNDYTDSFSFEKDDDR